MINRIMRRSIPVYSIRLTKESLDDIFKWCELLDCDITVDKNSLDKLELFIQDHNIFDKYIVCSEGDYLVLESLFGYDELNIYSEKEYSELFVEVS